MLLRRNPSQERPLAGHNRSLHGRDRDEIMTDTSHGKADLTGLCVLIAEDDFLLALSLEASVEDLGGEVMGPVAMAADGIARVRKTAPQMAFLDVQLRDGLVTPLAEVLARLGVPFALITGYQGEELKQMPLSQAPRLSKPYRPSDFTHMAAQLREIVVSRRAHAIWQQEGRPEGAASRHWAMAERELRGDARRASQRAQPQPDHVHH
jgi:hypothetical protein